MIKLLVPIGALLTGIALLLLGTGLLNTLLALRGSAEGFADQTLGPFYTTSKAPLLERSLRPHPRQTKILVPFQNS